MTVCARHALEGNEPRNGTNSFEKTNARSIRMRGSLIPSKSSGRCIRRRKYDPPIAYAPPPKPAEELYAELNKADAIRLMEIASKAILAVHSCSLAFRTRIPRLRSKSKANSRNPRTIRRKSECEAESKQKTMKTNHLLLAIVALVAAGGLWLARSAWRTHAVQKSSMGVSVKMPPGPNFDPTSAASLPGASPTGTAPGPDNQPK